jgi:hypothetical protein
MPYFDTHDSSCELLALCPFWRGMHAAKSIVSPGPSVEAHLAAERSSEGLEHDGCHVLRVRVGEPPAQEEQVAARPALREPEVDDVPVADVRLPRRLYAEHDVIRSAKGPFVDTLEGTLCAIRAQ